MYLWLQSLNMIRILVLAVSIIVFNVVSISQTRKEVNKNWKLLKTGSSEDRIKSAGFLHEYYTGENMDSIRIVGETLFKFAVDNDDYSCLEESKIILSESMIFNQKSTDAIIILKNILKNSENRNDKKQSAIISNYISEAYVYLKDGKSALVWSKKSTLFKNNLKESEKIKGQITLAESYFLLNNKKKGKQILIQLIPKLNKNNEFKRLAVTYGVLGRVYLEEFDFEKSKECFINQKKYSEKINLPIPISNSLNNLAIIDYENGKHKESKEKFKKALDLRLKSGYKKGISESYYNLGDYYFYLNDFENAKFWYLKSEKFCKNNNLYFEQIDALKALTQIAKSNKDYEEACNLFDEILKAQKTQSELQSKIDDDWAEINRQIILSDFEITQSNKKITKTNYIEWTLISILIVFVILLSLKLKKINSNDQGKSFES